MAKNKRPHFFDPAADINTRGKRKSFNTDGQPDQALMQDLVDSVTYFDESGDRARLDTGGAEFKDEVGLVSISTDVKAKANTSGFEADRTLVPHSGQLPTVDATDSQNITGTDPFTGVVLDATADATTTRNNFLIKLSSSFLTWFQALKDKVYTNSTNISTNGSGISGNASDIADLRTTTGTSDGDTNMGAYTGTVLTDLTSTKANIQELGIQVDTNVTNIATNVTNIATNTTNIATNVTNIATNITNIATNTSDISTNTGDISQIQSDIIVLQATGSTWKQVTITNWNMFNTGGGSATPLKAVPHGLSTTEFKTISNISATITDDTQTSFFNLEAVNAALTKTAGVSQWDGTNIVLQHLNIVGDDFDKAIFDDNVIDRGFVRFQYTPD